MNTNIQRSFSSLAFWILLYDARVKPVTYLIRMNGRKEGMSREIVRPGQLGEMLRLDYHPAQHLRINTTSNIGTAV